MRNFNLSLIFVPSCGLILAILQKVFNKVKFHVTYGSTAIVLHCIDRLSVPHSPAPISVLKHSQLQAYNLQIGPE